jgi:hypothetical protein
MTNIEYTFNELGDTAKVTALDSYRDINVDMEDWYDLDYEKELLNDLGFEDTNILWSGFSSQGDGACFTCANIDIRKFLKATNTESDFQSVVGGIERELVYMSGCIHHTGHYYHQRSTSLTLVWDIYLDEEDGYATTNNQCERLEIYLTDYIVSYGGGIYRRIERAYEDMTSDESVRETIICNDWLFDIEGNRI